MANYPLSICIPSNRGHDKSKSILFLYPSIICLDDITIEHLFLLSHLYYLCIYQQYANQHLSYYYNFDIF